MMNHLADSKQEPVKAQPHRAFYHAVSKQRWSVFQKREIQFWKQAGALRLRKDFVKHYYLPLLQPLILECTDNKAVLEIGSGPICTAQYLNTANQTYIDPLLDDYRRLFPGSMPEGSTYFTEMVEKIELTSHSFDCVICLNTLSDVHNPELVLNKVEKLLGVDGRFIVSIDTWPSWLARAHFLLSRFAPSLPRINRLYSYTLKGFTNSLARHFNIISVEPIGTRLKWLSLRKEYFFVCEHLPSQKSREK
jgi:SAM-dependent methyltransferase